MKKKKNRIILILLLVVVIIVGLIIWRNEKNNEDKNQTQEENTVTEKYVDILGDGIKLNKSDKLKETKKLDGLEISEIQLTYSNGVAVLLGNVKNTTNTDIDLTPIVLTLFDENGNIIVTLDGIISPVKAGKTVQLNIGVSADYANAYDFSIAKK